MYDLKELRICFLKWLGHMPKSICFNCRYRFYHEGTRCKKHSYVNKDYINDNNEISYKFCKKYNFNGNCPLYKNKFDK